MRNLRILLGKGETTVKFEDPLIIDETKMLVKAATVFWDFNNLTQPTFITHGGNRINFYNGYWTIGMIMERLKENDIKSELIPYSCKIKLFPTKDLALLKLGPLLGFYESATISGGGSQVGATSVNVNLKMKYIRITCNMIDGTKTSFTGKRDRTAAVLPITTKQILKGSVERFDNINSVAMLDNGIYNELKFEVNHDVGDILLEIFLCPQKYESL